VVAVYDQGDHAGTLFLAMEYVPGRTLRDVIRDESPLEPARALAILEEILKALGAAHEAGIVHRDIKPENVLITDAGGIKVADFGLARAISATTTATATGGVLMGTVSYLSPELVTAGVADARSDVYAAGVVLFEMLTGTKPHSGDSPIQVAYKHVHEDVPPPSSLIRGIPPYLDALVARATARKVELRPADAQVFVHQVRRVRTAIEQGVTDDPDLTDDLTPTAAMSTEEVLDAERTVVVPTPGGPPPASPEATPVERLLPSVDQPPRQPAAQPSAATARPRRRRRGLVLLLIVLLLAAGAGVGGWYYGVGRYTTTPDLVSLSSAEAESTLAERGLTFEVEATAYSETIPSGHVISTDPAEGDRVLEDGTVFAVISKGPERHDVPQLKGLPELQAVRLVTDNALEVGTVARVWHERVPEGVVVSFSPAAGTELKRGQAVDLVVSRGREPIEITSYIGEEAEKATRELGEAGFTVRVTQRFHPEIEAGEVISQTPSSGTGHRKDVIRLVVSKGPPLVEVPDVYRVGVEAATEALERAGFEVEVEENIVSFGLGFVVDQDPAGGDLAPKGSTVTIYVA
jgi:serine/threonine-protein kinase